MDIPLTACYLPDTFPSIGNSADWQYVRTTANFQSNGPVTSVNSEQMRCYERNPGTPAPGTYNATAGQTITYNAKASISHPGSSRPVSGNPPP